MRMNLSARCLILNLLLLAAIGTKSQEALMLHAMRQIPQSSVSNASYIPPYEAHFHLLLPATHVWVGNSAFRWNDFVKERTDGSFSLDFDEAIGKMKNRNNLIMGLRYEPLSFGFRFGRSYLSLTSQVRTEVFLQYPASMFNLLNDGVNAFTGNSVDFGETRFLAVAWMEHSIGYARNFNEMISAGIRLKFINGLAGVHLAKNETTLSRSSSSSDFSLMSNLVLNASYPVEGTISIPGNYGFGVDFGIKVSPVEELDLVAGFNDLGRINWKANLQNFSASDNAIFRFSGLNLNELFSNDSDFESGFETVSDSLSGYFDFNEFEASFKTSLPFNFHAGGMYRFTERDQAGFIMNFNLLENQVKPSASLLYQHNFGNVFALSTSLSYHNQHFANIGLGYSLNLGFFQMYMLSGNILSSFLYRKVYNAGVKFGFNFLVGRLDKNSKPIIIEIRDDYWD